MGATLSKSSLVEAKEKPIIMVLGGPGTGKGTQCDRMVKEFGFKHISLGDILRAEVKKETQIGKDCAIIMKEGKLVPIKLTMNLMQMAMKKASKANGYLLDGFPRAVNQAKEFQKQMKAPSLVIYLHAPSQVLIHRLLQRGETSGRADDNVETINKRLVTFRKQSVPVLSFYEKTRSTIVKKICTVTSPDDVFKQVREAVKQVLNSPPARLRKHVRRRRRPNIVHRRTVVRHYHHRRHQKRRKKRRKKMNMEECPGHPHGSPVAPAPPQQCVVM